LHRSGEEPAASRVLVVEDEAGIRDALAAALVDEGYEVRAAGDGRAALAVLRGWLPHVILLDLMMPVMDGWAFRAEQRRLDAARHIPVIVLSGARDIPAGTDKLGVAATIPKPFDLDTVLDRVGELAPRR
jgi:CheY-like chemotaxis protein